MKTHEIYTRHTKGVYTTTELNGTELKFSLL